MTESDEQWKLQPSRRHSSDHSQKITPRACVSTGTLVLRWFLPGPGSVPHCCRRARGGFKWNTNAHYCDLWFSFNQMWMYLRWKAIFSTSWISSG